MITKERVVVINRCPRCNRDRREYHGREGACPVRLEVRHAYKGCDTGCCGHEIMGVDDSGYKWCIEFKFDHPYGEDFQAWADGFSRAYFRKDLPVDASDVFDNC